MYLPIYALVQSQHGLVTRAQAQAAGLAPAEVNRLVATGRWVRLRRGVYADALMWRALDPFRGQPLLRVRAARLTLTCEHVLSHDSAALAHGMWVPRPGTALVHVTRRKVHGDSERAGVKHHRAPYSPDQVTTVDDLPVLDLARTALDMAREHSRWGGLPACDFALRQGVTRGELRDVLAAMPCWPQSRTVRSCIEDADAGSESFGETCGRALVLDLGIGRPQTQFGLSDGARTVWCDLRVGRHVFEFDGRLKYADDNPAALDPTEVVWREKLRQDFVSGFKLGVSRITTEDCGVGRRAALARLAREYADTCRRFGTSIDDLAPYVVTRRPAPRAG